MIKSSLRVGISQAKAMPFMQIYGTPIYLRNPEPDSLDDVSWMLFRPVSILSVQGCLASGDVGIRSRDPFWSLDYLPECVQDEKDWDADVGSKEVCDILVSGLSWEGDGSTDQLHSSSGGVHQRRHGNHWTGWWVRSRLVRSRQDMAGSGTWKQGCFDQHLGPWAQRGTWYRQCKLSTTWRDWRW